MEAKFVIRSMVLDDEFFGRESYRLYHDVAFGAFAPQGNGSKSSRAVKVIRVAVFRRRCSAILTSPLADQNPTTTCATGAKRSVPLDSN
jgi:hypothetical protein